MSTLPLIAMRGIVKRFGDVVALDGVDFELHRGEIHALLGENGAGKTTLMNVLSGLYRPDAGTITMDGANLEVGAPRDALRHGIGMVHQHFELVSQFTALENIILGREGSRLWLQRERQRAVVGALAAQYGLNVDLDSRVRSLAIGVQQKVEILKALYRGVRVLILDEPTTMLTPQEVDALFGTIASLTAQELTVVFITHKIREALAASQRVTVMRQGRIVASSRRVEVSEERLVELMIGREQWRGTPAPGVTARGRSVLHIRDLVVEDERRIAMVDGCTLEVSEGELLGVAGIAGNGQRELGEAIIGLRRPSSGAIALDSLEVGPLPVKARLQRGLAIIPEDRIRDGILPRMMVTETLMLGLHHFVFPTGWYQATRAERICRQAIADFQIVAKDVHVLTSALSGGNIQKTLVARAFLLSHFAHSRLLLAMNPTRGLDISATESVYDRLLDFVQHGGAVLLISEDLDELLKVTHRILVISHGRIVAEFPRGAFDAYAIGAAMVGVRHVPDPAPRAGSL